MELAESIKYINEQLAKNYGYFDHEPNWRVVLAGEQLEKRKVDVTEEGFELIYPEVREVKKYQHVKPNYYVLERKEPVEGQTDLVTKTSYEIKWTFEDRHGNYLPPRYDACKIIIEQINNSQGLNYVKKDPLASPEAQLAEINRMEELLFGNETPVGDALAHGYGVIVPGPERIQ